MSISAPVLSKPADKQNVCNITYKSSPFLSTKGTRNHEATNLEIDTIFGKTHPTPDNTQTHKNSRSIDLRGTAISPFISTAKL